MFALRRPRHQGRRGVSDGTIALSNSAIADHLRPPLHPKMGVPYAPKYANCHISATDDPINFMFSSRVGFSGSADRMSLFQVTSNPSWRQAAILDYFEWPYLRNGSFDPLVLRASRGHVCDSEAFLLILTLASWTQVPWKFHGRINSTQLVLRL